MILSMLLYIISFQHKFIQINIRLFGGLQEVRAISSCSNMGVGTNSGYPGSWANVSPSQATWKYQLIVVAPLVAA